ncbi:MAG: OsmC family protein [Candidatus Verstraetearchaeota archaeon]|jgi:organic hydroperoxide reductase OsmC/OhrA|nr:OsmC family protein [Candidatus Verstraetearchaeota archaeon]
MSEFVFEGRAALSSGVKSKVFVDDREIATISPPVEFGGERGYPTPENLFAAALASCMNTLFLLIAGNSKLGIQSLETIAKVNMRVEGLEKIIFTKIDFTINVKLLKDTKWEREKAYSCFEMAQRICPIRQSWGEAVPITFHLNIL